jgi:hypothetical protein
MTLIIARLHHTVLHIPLIAKLNTHITDHAYALSFLKTVLVFFESAVITYAITTQSKITNYAVIASAITTQIDSYHVCNN